MDGFSNIVADAVVHGMTAVSSPATEAVAGLRAELWDAGFRPVALYSHDATHADGGDSNELHSRGQRP